MATVNVQTNPESAVAGTRESDAVIITSEITVPGTGTLVNYQIEKISTSEVYNIDSLGTGFDRDHESEGGNVVDVNQKWLKIILESRTNFRVRTKSQFGDWGAWVNFKTRDKRYQSPHAITSLTDDTDSSSQTQGTKIINGIPVVQGGSRVIAITNNSKGIERDNASPGNERSPRTWGSVTVTNSDTIFGDGQLQRTGTVTTEDGSRVSVQSPVAFTNRGATVVNVPAGKNARIKFTNRGATVNTIG